MQAFRNLFFNKKNCPKIWISQKHYYFTQYLAVSFGVLEVMMLADASI